MGLAAIFELGRQIEMHSIFQQETQSLVSSASLQRRFLETRQEAIRIDSKISGLEGRFNTKRKKTFKRGYIP